VHFGSLEYDTGRRRVWQLGCLPYKRIKEVHGIELAKPVYSKVPINAIGVLSILIYVDTGTENKLLMDVTQFCHSK
jgi:hypothetical protein